MDYFQPDFEHAIKSALKRPIAGLNLCAACNKLRYWPAESRMRHYDDFNHLKAAASARPDSSSSKCWLCQTIYDEFFKYMGDRSHSRAGQWDAHVETPNSLLLWFAERTETGDGFLDHLRGYEPGARNILQHMSSKAAFGLLRAWVWRCDNQHKCWQGKGATLPTRVLDVSRDTPYLFITRFQRSPYITLSHCWGGEQPLVTTVATLRERRKGISTELFPALYQDAIRVTRELGIKYLWIDSLCILQDCKDDWASEAAKMADVYRQSYLTLYALTASNCHQKMLVERQAMVSDTSESLSNPESSSSSINQIGGNQRKYEHFRKAPLFRRAWAVQERLLSPRILYFSEEELFWECLKCTAREGSWQVDTHKQNMHRYEAYLCGQEKIQLSFHSSSSDWQMIVSEYTGGRLTYPSDKLPAISGLASLYQKYTGYTYMAGIWKETLLEGLLWFCPPTHKPQGVLPSSSELYRGPSWSWVSTDSAVRFKTFWEGKKFKLGGAPDIQFVGCKVKLRRAEKMGEIHSAKLTVKASFFSIYYQGQPDSRNCVIYDSNEDPFGKGVLDAEGAASLGQQPCAAIFLAQRGRERFTWEDEDVEYDKSKYPWPRCYGEHDFSTGYFILVVPVPNSEKKERWKRIGLAWTYKFIDPAPELSVIEIV